MSDPNENFNRGASGQAPPSGGSALDDWAAGAATRQWNQRERTPLGGVGGPLGPDPGPFVYTAPPDPRILSAGLLMVSAFIVLIFSVPIFGSLYPLSTIAGFATAYGTDAVVRHAWPALDPSDRPPIDMLVGAVAFWIASRTDHRVAASLRVYRYGRHALRLVLISSATATACLNPSSALVARTPWEMHAIVTNPMFLPILIGTGIAAHFGLRSSKLRGKWDRGLQIFGLRPRGLKA